MVSNKLANVRYSFNLKTYLLELDYQRTTRNGFSPRLKTPGRFTQRGVRCEESWRSLVIELVNLELGKAVDARSKKEELHIVLLGKTGDGKSSGNTILNEKAFIAMLSPNSTTQKCESKSGTIHKRPAAVVDTPGFFDTDLPDDEQRSRIVECLIQCAPGVHAFLIVLKVGTYTDQEKEVVKKITETFGEAALKYSVVLFTHGHQLNDGQTIENIVWESETVQELVDKCGGRCHVIDNRYLNQQQDEYRNNSVQVQNLLDTIEAMLRANGGIYYTNELLQRIQEEIEAERNRIREHVAGNISDVEIGVMAEESVFKKFMKMLAGVATGVLLGQYDGILLGNRGHFCLPFLMTLYPDPGAQSCYNLARFRTRARVEMTIGILKVRFQCPRGLRVSPERSCEMIVASVVLHNVATV
ncbi:GTPase IMAP family member 7-like [Chanos chanos]|uniref:GTPase IMAP family member 7-like n=1 Tax=Chanos chanos TaxID=29144 RepID=A0A6J2VVN1_CHACN|nr:GTPase IMAP family member 7-like [Chanos chanos]